VQQPTNVLLTDCVLWMWHCSSLTIAAVTVSSELESARKSWVLSLNCCKEMLWVETVCCIGEHWAAGIMFECAGGMFDLWSIISLFGLRLLSLIIQRECTVCVGLDLRGHSTSFQPVVPTWPSQICLIFCTCEVQHIWWGCAKFQLC